MLNTDDFKPSLNGMSVIARNKTAIYLRIPMPFQLSCGGCNCKHCALNPAGATWDTLVVPIQEQREYARETAYTVHMPDGAIQEFKDYCKRMGL